MSSAVSPSSGGGSPDAIAARIAVEDGRWETALPDHEALIANALAALAVRCALHPAAPSELGVTLANDAAVQVLNARWRDKDKPTNVLSFPMRALSPGDAPGAMLGDLVLALETLEREAAGERKTLADHFSHLVVHGTLHCLGYDHATNAEADAMEAREILVLGDLGIADPYFETEVEKEPIRA